MHERQIEFDDLTEPTVDMGRSYASDSVHGAKLASWEEWNDTLMRFCEKSTTLP